jgi:hypothetical protein
VAAVSELGSSLMREGSDNGQLLAQLARGDDDALASLYAPHGRRLFTYVFALTGDRTAAEEIVQDTFVAAWRGVSAFRGESSVDTWLFAIARRRAGEPVRWSALDAVGSISLLLAVSLAALAGGLLAMRWQAVHG